MKKIISMLLCIGICLSTASIVTYAKDNEEYYVNISNATEYISPNEQLTKFLARTDITSVKKEAAINKHILGQALANGNGLNRTTRSTLTANTLDVPWFSQIYNYYCGPATIKQTVHYLNGTSDSQTTIATDLGTTSTSGTDTNNMKNYLNDNTDCTYEVLWWWANADAFSDMVISNTDSDIPIIGHVSISVKGDWPFTTGGHYINYNGYSSSGDYFDVTDPYVDRYGDTDGKYTISNDEAERVTGRIIW